ncbi:MAG: phospholipase D family protein [Planctomycetota bacterium]
MDDHLWEADGRRGAWQRRPERHRVAPMVEYLDSGGGDPGMAVGTWLAEHLVPGVQAVRIQTGFFSIGSLRDHFDTLAGIDVVRLVLGSNAPEQPTADDVRQLVPLIAGHLSRSLTLVRFAGSALFHPKTIHLVRKDGTALAYVGSANMTEYGLGFNAEAGIVLGPDAGDALDAIAAATDAWAVRDEQGVFQVRGECDVDDLLAQGVLQTAEQRRATRATSRRQRRASGEGAVGSRGLGFGAQQQRRQAAGSNRNAAPGHAGRPAALASHCGGARS